jgi:hypothetical protein
MDSAWVLDSFQWAKIEYLSPAEDVTCEYRVGRIPLQLLD